MLTNDEIRDRLIEHTNRLNTHSRHLDTLHRDIVALKGDTDDPVKVNRAQAIVDAADRQTLHAYRSYLYDETGKFIPYESVVAFIRSRKG